MQRPSWLAFDPNEPLILGGRTIPGRIWTASGCFAYGLTGHDMTSDAIASPYERLGAVVTKTVTSEPRSGNPMPRLCELPYGALNSIGLENVGLAAFVDEIFPELERRSVSHIVSLAATQPSEFGPMTESLQIAGGRFQHWHGIELNLSCPNVAEGGHDFGADPATVTACVEIARRALPDRALLVKLTPNVADLAGLARAAAAGGADAVSAINTVVGLEVDLATGLPVLPRRFGGYSGPAILPIALAKVDQIISQVQIPVVGVGGISSTADALKFFALGAVAVQVGTAQMRDPFTAARIAAELADQ